MVFLWQLTGPESLWTLDLKTAPGGIHPGESTPPNCTLTLSEADFLAMSRGELNPQSLYFDGKLKIAGDVMASQKLTFLKDIDPEHAKAAVAKAKAEGGLPKASVAKTKVAKSGPSTTEILASLASVLKEHPELGAEVGALVELRETNSGEAWTLDLRAEPVGERIQKGPASEPDSVFSIAIADLQDLVGGKVHARELFQQGKLRVDGDVGVAKRLGSLKQSLRATLQPAT